MMFDYVTDDFFKTFFIIKADVNAVFVFSVNNYDRDIVIISFVDDFPCNRMVFYSFVHYNNNIGDIKVNESENG